MSRSAQPTFSVIVPTYCRPEQLKVVLHSLSVMNYPMAAFEVIVVDDESVPPPDEVADSFRSTLHINLLKQKHSGPAAARNLGVGVAKNQYVAFTDDDCAVAPDWLQKYAFRFAELSECGIGGSVSNGLPENTCSTSSQLLMEYLYGYYNSNPHQARFCTTNNLAFPTEIFLKNGGFDVSFQTAEDREFCDRWIQNGNRLIYAPEVMVYHYHELNLRKFLKQHFNYGRGALHFRTARIQRNLKPVPIEPMSFYFQLLRYPFSKSSLKRPWSVSTLMLLSQVANALGFFTENLDRNKAG